MMLKKVVLIIIGLAVVIALPILFLVVKQNTENRQKAAPATTMALSPAAVTKNVNDEFSLDAVLDTGANAIQLVQIELSFDPTKLKPLSFTNSATFPNIISSEEFTSDGKAKISVGTPSIAQPFTGVATAATIRFQVLAPSASPVSITYTAQTFVGSIAEGQVNSLIGTSPATITIGSGTAASPTPTQLAQAGSPTPSPTLGAGVTPTATKTPTPTVAGQPSATPTTGSGTPTATPTTADTSGLNLVIASPQNGATVTSLTPAISGTAKAGSSVTVALYPGGTTSVVTVDSTGNWTYTPPTLGQGVYTLSVTASDPLTGATQNSSISFTINSTGTVNSPTPTPAPTSIAIQPTPTTGDTASVPVTGNVEITLVLAFLGVALLGGGAVLPLIFK